MFRNLNGDTVVGVTLALVGLGSLWATFQIDANVDGGSMARVFPLAASTLLTGLGVFEAIKAGHPKGGAPLRLGAEAGKVLQLVVLAALYIWAITQFGYLISTPFVTVAALWVFGIRSPVGLALAAAICPVFYHLIFFKLLGVFPPYGSRFDLLDVIQGF